MKGKYQIQAVVNFVAEADNRAAAHIVAVDALTAAGLDGFDLSSLNVSGLITTGGRGVSAPRVTGTPDGTIVYPPVTTSVVDRQVVKCTHGADCPVHSWAIGVHGDVNRLDLVPPFEGTIG